MRQLSKFFILIIMCFCAPAYSAVQGRLEYQIPIDYTKLSEEELMTKAGFYYRIAKENYSGKLNDEMTSALNLYTVLQRKCPENSVYNIRLGELYDIIGQDRQAKGCFYGAIGTSPDAPEAYFRFGEFYYRRNLFRKALKFYTEAYKKGFDTHYDTLFRMGDIYEKLGDTERALEYFKYAYDKNPNTELENRLKKVEALNAVNKAYYSNKTKLRD